jgi:hypothetical protein
MRNGEGAGDLEHDADGGGSGACRDAAGRAELCVCGPQQNGHWSAQQTAVTLGDTVGNNYSISSGLNPGTR